MKAIATALLLLALTGCDKSFVTDFNVSGKVTTTVAGTPTQPTDPNPPPVDPTDPTDPVPPPPVTGYDLNTSALLFEGFNKRLDPIGPPDAVSVAPLGVEFGYSAPIYDFERYGSCYRWTGAIVPPESGDYAFEFKIKSAGLVKIDGQIMWAVDREQDAGSHDQFTVKFNKTLVAGKATPIVCVLIQEGGERVFQAKWKRPSGEALEPLAAVYCAPPADWQARLKPFKPAPPPELPFAQVDWDTYQSPPLPRMLPDDHWWNQRVDHLPVDPLSDKIIARLGTAWLHPVFGQHGNGIPYNVVSDDAPKVPIASFLYASESDPGPYPIPDKPVAEPGTDNHVLIVTPTRLFELHHVSKDAAGWHADSGAIFNLDGSTKRPDGWTSADAAGLEITPGLVRFDEAASGEIRHKLRISVGKTRRAYVPPANHWTGDDNPANFADDLPPMGCVFRLKASYDLSGAPPQVRPLLEAGKVYGFPVADNGSVSFIGLCGAPDSRWKDDELAWMKRVKATDFEVVKMDQIITEVP